MKHVSDQIAVMYLGEIVELSSADEIYRSPRHPYTQALISAIPAPDPRAQTQRILLSGDVPSPIRPPRGCRFHTRCRHADETCRQQAPALGAVEGNAKVACHHWQRLKTAG